jgi:hypothetical protein
MYRNAYVYIYITSHHGIVKKRAQHWQHQPHKKHLEGGKEEHFAQPLHDRGHPRFCRLHHRSGRRVFIRDDDVRGYRSHLDKPTDSSEGGGRAARAERCRCFIFRHFSCSACLFVSSISFLPFFRNLMDTHCETTYLLDWTMRLEFTLQ